VVVNAGSPIAFEQSRCKYDPFPELGGDVVMAEGTPALNLEILMTKLFSAVTLALFATVAFNAQAASHAGGAPMAKASAPAAPAAKAAPAAPAAKASAPAAKTEEKKK
jgi:nucleoid-associated protein YgaU